MSWTMRLLRGLEILLACLIFTGLLSGASQRISNEPDQAVHRFTRPFEFDFVQWTVDALGIKLTQASLGSPFYFPETDRHQIVSNYLALVDLIQQKENQLNLVYTDPSVRDPVAASAVLRLTLADAYARQEQLAPLAEAVLQEQIGATLAGLHLTTGGQPLPPVLFHFTPLPYNLILSPRDKIQQEASISLVPDLPVDQQDRLERRVDASLGVSSLVVPVGGIGSYPTMVMRTTSLDWLADTIAHEWIHNWLTLRPLGLNYETTPELRTMNETTASIAGHEIAVLVLQRYYPELSAAAGLHTVSLPAGPIGPGEWVRPVFDFQAEMHTTRLHVDALLAEGMIGPAEAYMEQRRQVFWDHGYAIRKLNQAYFAFYGAYADSPGGAAGEDPVGPAVRALRAQSVSLTAFLERIGRMSSFQQLQAAISP
jgi:hypothetical protein